MPFQPANKRTPIDIWNTQCLSGFICGGDGGIRTHGTSRYN